MIGTLVYSAIVEILPITLKIVPTGSFAEKDKGSDLAVNLQRTCGMTFLYVENK